MVTKDDTKHLFAYVSPGDEHEVGRRIIPTLTSAGTLAEEEDDGTQHVRESAKRFLRSVGVVSGDSTLDDLARALNRPPILFADSDFELIVTDARVVILGNQIRSDGSRIVGQLRHPWIQSVQFHPKQSFLNDSELVIETVEDFDVDVFPERQRGYFAHRFSFVFDKRLHPGELARAIAQRAARYVEATQGVPSSPALTAMRDVAALPDPPKGEYASYDLPEYCSFPQGFYRVGDGQDAADWLGQW